MSARSTLAALALIASFGAAGCGSSGSSGSSSAKGPFTRAQLAAKADAICSGARTAAGKIVAPTDFGQPNSSADAAAAYLAKIQPITRKEANDLAALKPDSEASTDWAALVAGEKSLADLLDQIVAKAKAHDKSGLKQLAGSAARGKPFVDAANKIGAKGCAGG